jgi:hypothetical protein
LIVRAVLNDRVNVTLCELPLAVLCSTGVLSFQLTSTFDRFPSTSAALTTIVYDCPVVTLAPLVLVSVNVGGCWTGAVTLNEPDNVLLAKSVVS